MEVAMPKSLVEAAEIRDKGYILFDSELPGFAVRVLPSRSRYYIIQYNFVPQEAIYDGARRGRGGRVQRGRAARSSATGGCASTPRVRPG